MSDILQCIKYLRVRLHKSHGAERVLTLSNLAL